MSGGLTRSSVEALVMRVERRGWRNQILFINNFKTIVLKG